MVSFFSQEPCWRNEVLIGYCMNNVADYNMGCMCTFIWHIVKLTYPIIPFPTSAMNLYFFTSSFATCVHKIFPWVSIITKHCIRQNTVNFTSHSRNQFTLPCFNCVLIYACLDCRRPRALNYKLEVWTDPTLEVARLQVAVLCREISVYVYIQLENGWGR